ncbi:MAG: transporter substrate-binding domain-containing protein [Propionibacteriaceae bacterium]|jgi:polar amino acid transport system substrate-binding protein|nr:transporter substrate-binding domain-containing protein [Propionibacteriaceae bacterium]
MSNKLKVAVALATAVAFAFGAVGCAASGTSAGTNDKTYVIYSDNAFAPFEYLDTATNKYVGVDMDLLAAIAKDQGFSYEVKNEGFDAAMGAVQAGQADGMIAGMTITDKRKETFDFSDGYFDDGQIMVVPADSSIASLDDLKGKIVAAKASTQGATYADENKDKYGYTTQIYEDSPTMYQAVENGSNAACFEDRSVIGWAIKQGDVKLKTVGDILNPGQYGFAVKKGSNPELIDMFNKGLANLKASGEYDKILAQYGY